MTIIPIFKTNRINIISTIFLILFLFTIGCNFKGPLISKRIDDRNKKYVIELSKWDSPMAFGSGTNRLKIKANKFFPKIVELNGTGRFYEVYWQNSDTLIIIDMESSRTLEKHGINEFRYGPLLIKNVCFIENGGYLSTHTCDSISLDQNVLNFYNKLENSSKATVSVPADQFLLSYVVKNDTLEFEYLPDFEIGADTITDFKVLTVLCRIKVVNMEINHIVNLAKCTMVNQ